MNTARTTWQRGDEILMPLLDCSSLPKNKRLLQQWPDSVGRQNIFSKPKKASWPWLSWTACQLLLRGNVCHLILNRICWALLGYRSHHYKSWVNSDHQSAIADAENYWGSRTRPCVIKVWCKTESGDMSCLQYSFLQSAKYFFARSRMTDWCLYIFVDRWELLEKPYKKQIHT